MSLVVENTLPGVTAIINQSQVARPIQRQPTSTAFAVGYSPWGPVSAATVVTSWADYARTFGGFDANSFLDDFCYAFFNLFPGRQVVISRVVGGSAAVATFSLPDRAGTPINTLRVDAKYPSSRVDVRVTVEAGTLTNTVKLIFRSVFLNRREIFDNVTLTALSLDEINQKSSLVKVVNLGSATAAPNNLPAVRVETLLAGGNDNFSGLNAASFVGTDDGTTRTGLQVFKDEELGTGQVAIPGITDATVHAALIAHGATFKRLALLDPPLGSDKAAVLAIRALYGTWYAAIYWPWVLMLDFEPTGLKKFYPPSAFAAGACAQADRTIGTHKAPANIQIGGALGVETTTAGQSQTDDNTRELLNGKDINVIAPLPEQGIKVYGARVMTSDRRIQMVHEIRLMNLFYYSAKLGYRWAPFSVVDATGRLFRDLRATGVNFLRDFWRSGALFGATEAEAFSVVADASNNPPSELALQRVRVQWGVKLSPTAETIIINVDNVPLFQDLSVLQQ